MHKGSRRRRSMRATGKRWESVTGASAGSWSGTRQMPAPCRSKPPMTNPNGSHTQQLVRHALTHVRTQQSRRRRYDQWTDQPRMPDTSRTEPLTMTRSKGRATTSASSACANVEMATARKVHLVLQGKGGVGNLFPTRGAAPTPPCRRQRGHWHHPRPERRPLPIVRRPGIGSVPARRRQ